MLGVFGNANPSQTVEAADPGSMFLLIKEADESEENSPNVKHGLSVLQEAPVRVRGRVLPVRGPSEPPRWLCDAVASG